MKAELSSIASENVGNVKTVKAFAGEQIAAESFELSNIGVTNIGKNMALYMAVMFIFFTTFFNSAFVGMSYFASMGVEDKELTTG